MGSVRGDAITSRIDLADNRFRLIIARRSITNSEEHESIAMELLRNRL